MAPNPAKVYQIKVTLQHSEPPIWRRLLIPPDMTLRGLHLAIQAAFGWEEAHPHEFQIKSGEKMTRQQIQERMARQPGWYPDIDGAEAQGLRVFSDPRFGLEGVENESRVRVGELLTRAHMKMLYRYDFDDDWTHEIVYERGVPSEPQAQYPVCIAGERAAPWEDCGGIDRWEGLIEARTDPDHPDREQLEMTWEHPETEFDPERFDREAVNKELRKFFRAPKR